MSFRTRAMVAVFFVSALVSPARPQAQVQTSEDRGSGEWEAANTPVIDAAIARAKRWATIQDLQRRIAGLEGDAQDQDDLANQLEHTGKGKNDAITKLFNAVGSVSAVKYHVEAAKYRAEAARLREELAKIENQAKFSAGVPAP